jgi:hypothetical protein
MRVAMVAGERKLSSLRSSSTVKRRLHNSTIMALSRFALRNFCLPKTPGLRTYINPARTPLLKEIYADLRKLDPRSEEYKVLARSGDCWYNYFQPDNSERYGYHELQKVNLISFNGSYGQIN